MLVGYGVIWFVGISSGFVLCKAISEGNGFLVCGNLGSYFVAVSQSSAIWFWLSGFGTWLLVFSTWVFTVPMGYDVSVSVCFIANFYRK
jgi:hypothetical protein